MSAMRAGWLGLLACLAAAPGWGLDLEPGRWETRANVFLPGASFPLPVIRSTRCLTPEDPVPNAVRASERQRCRVLAREVKGNEVRWRVLCEDRQGLVDGRGRITYGGRLFEGEMRVAVLDKERARRAELLYRLKGAWKGPCEQGAEGERTGPAGRRER